MHLDYWSTAPCLLSIKLAVDGTIALVHAVPADLQPNKKKIIDWVEE